MIITVVIYIWIILQFIIGYNLILPVFLYLLHSLRTISVDRESLKPLNEADYAIIVTAYQQTTHISSVISSLLRMNYERYIIYVVADCCDDTSFLKFEDKRIILLRPEIPLRSNVGSHFYAINHFIRKHDRLTIIDSDNLVNPNYLIELNKCFNEGYLAVQGFRMAKNIDTMYARLDAARDIYYHFYDGKILFEIGSSATLAGSGMAFTTKLYVQCLAMHTNLCGPGFDKILQAEILKRGYQIAFTDKAIVYDEKTAYSKQLVDQRSRWISTWFKYFKYGFVLTKIGIIRRNFNQFLFGLILLRPPLFMFLICSFICFVINLFINPLYSLYWLIGFSLFIAGFYIALIKSNTRQEIYQSLYSIPQFMFFQLVAAFKLIMGQKLGKSTKHFSTITIEELNNQHTV
jgi:cellulose synthase/poly-beta-1,6-N-acetylglucosamine synthase-like glycosyltransferase